MGQLFKILFCLKMLVISEIIWDHDFSWYKRVSHEYPLFFRICSLNFVKNTARMTGRLDENMMFKNREMVSSSRNLSSRRKEKSEETLRRRKCDTGPDRHDRYLN